MRYRAAIFLTLLTAGALSSGALPGCSDTETPGAANTEPNGTLAPPATLEQGWQFTNEPFDVEPGTERQICYFVEVPYNTESFFNRIQATHAAGSHHMNIFRVKTVKNLGGKNGDIVEDGECWKSANWSDWPLVINNQTESEATDWTLPEGVAHKFEAHEMLMVQSHYVNATTQKTPGVGKVTVNFYKTPKEKVTAELGTVFATNQNIEICPGEINKKFESTCKFAKDGPVTVIGANGHFHSRGLDFTMSTFDPNTGGGSQFYDNRDWSHPLFDRDLDVNIPQGGGMKFTCTYAVPASECGDPTNKCCFTFGGKVETQEHCNAFVYYYPKSDTDQNCF
ncbi:MAG: hypothetical protein U0165_10050 [Polyangiaceae bacterium]